MPIAKRFQWILIFAVFSLLLIVLVSASNDGTVSVEPQQKDLLVTDESAYNNDAIVFQSAPATITEYLRVCGPDTRLTTGKRTINVASTAEAQAAINAAKPGDVIRLAKGNYGLLTVHDVEGTQQDPITIEAAKDAYREATILGSNNGSGINVRNSSYIAIRNLEITKTRFGIFAMGLENSTLENNHIHDTVWKAIQVSQVGNENGVTGRPSSNVDILCNTVHGTGIPDGYTNGHNGEGIYVGSGFVPGDRTFGVDVIFNEVYDTTGEAIELKPLVTKSRVINNKVYDVRLVDQGNGGAIAAQLTRELKGFTDIKTDPEIEISGNRIWNVTRAPESFINGGGSKPWDWSAASGIRVGGPVTIKENLIWDTQDAGIKIQDIYRKQGLFNTLNLTDNILFNTAIDPLKPTGQLNLIPGVLNVVNTGNFLAEDASVFAGPVTGSATGEYGEGSGFINTASGLDFFDEDYFW